MANQLTPLSTSSLADILDKILDKGLVVVGDIKIALADVELLTIKVRLILASLETAQAVGIDWWKSDPFLNSKARELELERSKQELEQRVAALEAAAQRA